MKTIGKYLEAYEMPNYGKVTRAFEIINTAGQNLGTVQWYGGWRQYVFTPRHAMTIDFNHGCLTDIARFLRELTQEQMENAKRRRQRQKSIVTG